MGFEKPGSNGAVKAAKVYNLNPSMLTLPLKIVQVNNPDDAAVEENMPFEDLNGNSQDDLNAEN